VNEPGEDLLLRELPALLAERGECVEDVLGLVVSRLRHLGLGSACVDTSGEPGGGAVWTDPSTLRLPLRLVGHDLGVLELRWTRPCGAPGPLRPGTAEAVVHHVAVAALDARARRRDADEAVRAAAVRRLFEEGARATSVPQAGAVLARVTAEVLGTERVAVHVADSEGRIVDVFGFGVPEEVLTKLVSSLTGRSAEASPIWRAARETSGAVLGDAVSSVPGRPGGFVETMQLTSYAAMPLLSATGPVGMVVCGDTAPGRRWTPRDQALADQLALEGALVVDSARLREVEAWHLAQLQHRADHDALTGLPNRCVLLAEAADAVRAGRPCSGLLLVDLDGFKAVNDVLGHHAGDRLLQEVATRLSSGLRAGDVAARLGGDEFAVLLRDVTPGEVDAVAHRLAELVGHPVPVDGASARVGASIGMATSLEHVDDAAGLLRAADEAMYRAKRSGSGREWAGARTAAAAGTE
jgi:diguanylate cyclase (GGDEF)-like protein